MPGTLTELYRLAQLHGVQTAYYDVAKRRRQASPDSLLAVLRALGVELNSLADVPAALKEYRRQLAERAVEPVTVAWRGKRSQLQVMLPEDRIEGIAAVTLELENGESRHQQYQLPQCTVLQEHDLDDGRYLTIGLDLPEDLPEGYHQLILDSHAGRYESCLICAPRWAYSPAPREPLSKSWGCFVPLYALQSEHSWGAGDFSDLKNFTEWMAGLGGRVVGTLPLLSTYLDSPYDPSPYAPVSRMFWNEFYIDVTQIPELDDCAEAKRLLDSAPLQEALRTSRDEEFVDYRRLMSLKRQVLELLAEKLFAEKSARFHQLQRFVEDEPQVDSYARFRATQEQQRTPWLEWPSRLRDGVLHPEDGSPKAERYHLFAQWIASEQLKSLVQKADEVGAALYLDLPLGVRPDGYDVWRYQQAYVATATVGAPPDAVFTKGQDWGFSPIHPEGIREQKYRHVVEYIRHHLRFAHVLRIDHVMGLHRLFWVPQAMSPDQGVYVQYRPEELYAILNLESHRHRACLVGENLGTVPTYVNRAMTRHRIRRMYVVEYELHTDGDDVLSRVSRGSVASLNTHDMPYFAAWWNGEDIPDRLALGLLDAQGAENESQGRNELKQKLIAWLRRNGRLDSEPGRDEDAVMRALLKFLADSPAEIVLVNLEDLWRESRPQNVPGTGLERPNWRRKAHYDFEEFSRMPEVLEVLTLVDQMRKRAHSSPRGLAKGSS